MLLRDTPLRWTAIAWIAALAACAPIHHDFDYTPNLIEQPVPQAPLKIAVLPFVDNRQVIDEGSHAWSWLPLVPSAAETKDGPQDVRDRAGSEYYFPDLIAYTVAVDLNHNGVGGRIDLAPPALEDYDLVIHGALNATTEKDRVLTSCGVRGGTTTTRPSRRLPSSSRFCPIFCARAPTSSISIYPDRVPFTACSTYSRSIRTSWFRISLFPTQKWSTGASYKRSSTRRRLLARDPELNGWRTTWTEGGQTRWYMRRKF